MAKSGMVIMHTVHPGPFHDERLRQEVRNAIRRTMTRMRNLFHATHRTWQTRVDWDEVESTAGGIAYASITTDSPLYYMINKGAEQHEIYAVNAPFLAFNRPYEAKTEPRVLSSGNATTGNRFYRQESVVHPGFEAREFDEAVREEVEEDFEQECRDAVENFARKSGHSMSSNRDNSTKKRVQGR